MSYQDWEPITIVKKKPVEPKFEKKEKDIIKARAAGMQVSTKKKATAASNAPSRGKETVISRKKLEDDSGDAPMKVPTISREQALAIQRKRCELKMTQAQLATRISEPVKIINEYEQGKGLPSQSILTKLERVLGIKLRGL
ncbi:putative multiprotein binding factor 1 [Monocercomonoides exilis]|uniref:putative multiprotein binding factor 1 n=1 Tax=Monocercomonoides exilis TaxID=2049356 RepID=UPI00355A4B2A|nr:putative multiprotein binding factor 1 [Monocercomonoides exilis]